MLKKVNLIQTKQPDNCLNLHPVKKRKTLERHKSGRNIWLIKLCWMLELYKSHLNIKSIKVSIDFWCVRSLAVGNIVLKKSLM